MADPIFVGVKYDFSTALAALLNLEHAANDLRPVFADVVDASLTRYFQRQFVTEGKHGGVPWPALAPRTLQARKRPGHGRGGILRDTNRLWAGYTKAGGPGSIREIEKDRYARGVNVKYAQFHYPKRPVVNDPLPAYLTTLWEDAIAKHLEQA